MLHRRTSKAVWDELSEEQQATVQSAAEAAAESGRQAQLEKEANLVSFLTEQGLEVYEPDLQAFRDHVQGQYAGSDLAASWPEGVLDKINAQGEFARPSFQASPSKMARIRNFR